jgi:hypothetical protein
MTTSSRLTEIARLFILLCLYNIGPQYLSNVLCMLDGLVCFRTSGGEAGVFGEVMAALVACGME